MNTDKRPARRLEWIGSSKKDYMTFPPRVLDAMGFALHLAQAGERPLSTKPLKGYGSGVAELVNDHDGDTYRAVYTVKFEKAVYVLHAFQKKSKKGVATPKSDLDLIEKRLRGAAEHYAAHYGREKDR